MRHHQQRPVRLENGQRWLLQATPSLNSITLSEDEPAVAPECIFHTLRSRGLSASHACDVMRPLYVLTTGELKHEETKCKHRDLDFFNV